MHLHYYCCINETTNVEGGLFLEVWRQRDYCWGSRPPASPWPANRWPLCQTWTTGQHYLHIESLSEQESLSLHSPVSLVLKEQLVYFVCTVERQLYMKGVLQNINWKRKVPAGGIVVHEFVQFPTSCRVSDPSLVFFTCWHQLPVASPQSEEVILFFTLLEIKVLTRPTQCSLDCPQGKALFDSQWVGSA